MDGKQAHAIIELKKNMQEVMRLAELQVARRYRVYRVDPITSLFHTLPFVDVHDVTEGVNARSYLLMNCRCSPEEVWDAVAAADAGKMGVCVRSRWTTYLVERLD